MGKGLWEATGRQRLPRAPRAVGQSASILCRIPVRKIRLSRSSSQRVTVQVHVLVWNLGLIQRALRLRRLPPMANLKNSMISSCQPLPLFGGFASITDFVDGFRVTPQQDRPSILRLSRVALQQDQLSVPSLS